MTAEPTHRYLHSYLAPLEPLLKRPEVTDIYVNRPGEVWVETITGGAQRLPAPDLDDATLWRLARQIASFSDQGVNREHPLLSAILPGGERVQIVTPPATRAGIAMAVRKYAMPDLGLEDYERAGAFAKIAGGGESASAALERQLSEFYNQGQVTEFLRLAVRGRKNIVISGGTSSGKTTFLNALLKEIPADERLILVEDVPEIRMDRTNSIGLVASRGELGEAKITMDDLVRASLRMRPDRILLGELRGPEAASFLRAVNTGHPGSITTIHADSPIGAVEQLCLLVLQSGLNLTRTEIADYVRGVVDIFVQLGRRDGYRSVSQIIYQPRSGACFSHSVGRV
jgi:type IV secretion system protein VirB11